MSMRNLDKLFRPASIALIGAGRDERSVGRVLARNLTGGGFAGPILPVHPTLPAVNGLLAYPGVDALPLVPDLAVIATPASTVPGLIDALGRLGTKAAVVLSAGFGEAGADGGALQTDLLEASRPHLLRIVGPNCLGVAVPGLGLNATFAPTMPPKGDIALVSQSGAVLTSILDWAAHRGVGFSHVVSLGNMADVDVGDLLDYLLTDPGTRTILLYVETITHARKFMSAARAAARVKPVVVVKGGRSSQGAKAASSHTGALAGEDRVYDAAFRRAGMLRVLGLGNLFAAVETLGKGFDPKGDRLAIVGNGGGLGVLATDALIEGGGRLAELEPATVAELDGVLPPTWSRGNPVDIIGDADGPRYARAVETLLAAPEADAVLVLNCPTAVASSLEAAEAVVGTLRGRKRPVLAGWVGESEAAGARRRLGEARIPCYATPAEAVEGFMQLVQYRRNQEKLAELPPAFAPEIAPDRALAEDIIAAARDAGRAELGEVEAKRLLAAYGIETVPTVLAATPEEAGAAAVRIGLPVALKIHSPDISHKSDVDGVRLDLKNEPAVVAAAETMLRRVRDLRPDARIEGFAVQAMAPRAGAIELIMGAKDDPIFGPVIAFGSGGTAVEVLDDVALDLVPLNPHLARGLMARTKAWRLMQGYRNQRPVAVDEAALTLVRLSQLVTDLDRVAELDINPLLATPDGVVALDARVRLAEPRARGVARLAIRPYPQELEGTLRLRDGAALPMRPIRPEDAAGLQAMIEASEVEDLRLRFFSALRRLPPQMAARLTQIDYDREMAFVVLSPDRREVWGTARLHAEPGRERAEYGILVRSDQKGRGLGYLLMQALIAHANRSGLGEIYGEVLAENRRMQEVCASLGFAIDRKDAITDGIVHACLKLQGEREAA